MHYGPCGAVLFVPGEQQQQLGEKFRGTVTKLIHSLNVNVNTTDATTGVTTL